MCGYTESLRPKGHVAVQVGVHCMGGRTWVAGPWRTTISHADVDTKEVYELDL